MLFAQRTGLSFEGMISPILITDPMLLFHKTKVICKGIDEICIMSYEEAKNRKLEIIARLWFSFESGKPMEFHDGCEGHHAKYYHGTFPLFKRIAYNTNSKRIGPTFNRLGEAEDILKEFIK